MSERSTHHATFVIERTYAAAPAQVFNAWADPGAKARWFAGPEDWESGKYELEFRVGGRERASGGPPGGPVHVYDARYQDIVPGGSSTPTTCISTRRGYRFPWRRWSSSPPAPAPG
jgi:uncharacterized protein YndB with AHSA1/START domain